jgi:hypothetical protein
MRTTILIGTVLTGAVALMAACQPATPPGSMAESPTAPIAPKAPAAIEAPEPVEGAAMVEAEVPAFVDKVWRVRESTDVEPGTAYAFLRDGTLVIDSSDGMDMPMRGHWNFEGGALTMTEEGIDYQTDIIQLDDNLFRIRSHNPGGAVEITLVPDPGARLPAPDGTRR